VRNQQIPCLHLRVRLSKPAATENYDFLVMNSLLYVHSRRDMSAR